MITDQSADTWDCIYDERFDFLNAQTIVHKNYLFAVKEQPLQIVKYTNPHMPKVMRVSRFETHNYVQKFSVAKLLDSKLVITGGSVEHRDDKSRSIRLFDLLHDTWETAQSWPYMITPR